MLRPHPIVIFGVETKTFSRAILTAVIIMGAIEACFRRPA